MVASQVQAVLDYHQATKHHFQAYAEGPGYLDWANQPNPFRRYPGARLIDLERGIAPAGPRYDAIFSAADFPAPAAVDSHSIARLLFDSLALSAWKSTGTSRWALRVNASSGNLHPTESYLVCGPVAGLCERPMVAHYAPKQHALEVRAEFAPELWQELSTGFPPGTLFVGLTSIHWREAWKYGRRAFRYCMHDAGHALGAVCIAAAGLGWHARVLDGIGSAELAALLGTSQPHEAEPEDPDLLIAILPAAGHPCPLPQAATLHAFAALDWQGVPNKLSASHVDWGMAQIAAAVRKPHGRPDYARLDAVPDARSAPLREATLRQLVRQRRSAVAMDGVTEIPAAVFYRLLERTLVVPGRVPFAALPWPPHLHLVLMVHRVRGIAPGLYLLVRNPALADRLRAALITADAWARPAGCPDTLPLYCLLERDMRNAARAIACHQDIASDGCFSLAMLAEFAAPLQRHGAWFYPRLFQEAGMLGQLLYLEAEAAGVRSTGIGCYFDDPLHEVLGLVDDTFQDLYHFTVGGPVEDARLTTLPAYG